MKVKKKCKYCFDEYNIDKRTTFYCDIRNVALHPECFGIYHRINVFDKKYEIDLI